MNTTMFVVHGFHQGRKLKPQHFSTEMQARACATSMGGAFDCVVLTTTTSRSVTQRCELAPAGSAVALSA